MEQVVITKDTIIGEILANHPQKAMELSQILMDFGIHCVGCMASGFETLEQGVLGHGYSEEELEALVNSLNELVLEKAASQKIASFDSSTFKVILTPKAVSKVKEIIKNEAKPGEEILRVAVLSGGCSGFVYDLELVKETREDDFTFEQEGLTVAVDLSSLEYLNGTTIDYLDTLNESGFKFQNPNSTKECGCGKSFS